MPSKLPWKPIRALNTIVFRRILGWDQPIIGGVQSFQDEKLTALGRIHCADEAVQAIQGIRDNGFYNFNIDLMHGLPDQSAEDALYDLQQAIALKPDISWYQLTIEPNTLFYSKTPVLPEDETLWAIQEQGASTI